MKSLEQIRADERALERARLVAAGECPHTDTFHDRAARITYAPGVEATPIDRHQDTGEPILNVLVEARRCHDCGAWLPIGEAGKVDPVELAAARLAAGYHDCHDTDDDLADSLVRQLIEYSVGECKLRTDRQQQAWALYTEVIDGAPQQDWEVL